MFFVIFWVNKDLMKAEKIFDFMNLWDDNQSNCANINDDNENDNISSNITLEMMKYYHHL
jgi:hypothetical protein